MAYARANPGKLTLATSSGASINHFMAELLKLKAGITWTEVHYRGNAPAINDLVAGHVDLGLQQLVDALQHIQAGKLRALAVLGPKRVAAMPDVPTIEEAGFPDVQGVTFNGLFAPKATPPAIVERLSAAIRAALEKKAVVDQLAALGSQARGSSPEEFSEIPRARNQQMDRRHEASQHQGDRVSSPADRTVRSRPRSIATIPSRS